MPKVMCRSFRVVTALDKPPFCLAQQFEVNSAFNIPAVVVAFIASWLAWKWFDMWSSLEVFVFVVVIAGECYVLFSIKEPKDWDWARGSLLLWLDGLVAVVFFLWVSLYLVVFFFLLGQHECVHSHNELRPHFTLHFVVCMGLSTGSHTSELRYVAALYSSDQAWLDGFCNSLNPSFARFISWVRRQQTSTAIAGYGLSSTNRRRVRNYILLIVQEMYRHYGNCYLFPFLSRVKWEDQD